MSNALKHEGTNGRLPDLSAFGIPANIGAPQPEAALVERREYTIQFGETGASVHHTYVDSGQSIRIPLGDSADVFGVNSEGDLTRQLGIVSKISAVLQLADAESSKFLTEKTLKHDIKSKSVGVLTPFAIVDPRRDTRAFLRGIRQNPDIAGLQDESVGETAQYEEGILDRTAVLGDIRSLMVGASVLPFALPGPDPNSLLAEEHVDSKLVGLALNEAGDGIQAIHMTKAVLDAVANQEVYLLGTVEIETDGNVVVSGKGVYLEEPGENRLPCLIVETAEQAEYPFDVGKIAAATVRRQFSPSSTAGVERIANESTEPTNPIVDTTLRYDSETNSALDDILGSSFANGNSVSGFTLPQQKKRAWGRRGNRGEI